MSNFVPKNSHRSRNYKASKKNASKKKASVPKCDGSDSSSLSKHRGIVVPKYDNENLLRRTLASNKFDPRFRSIMQRQLGDLYEEKAEEDEEEEENLCGVRGIFAHVKVISLKFIIFLVASQRRGFGTSGPGWKWEKWGCSTAKRAPLCPSSTEFRPRNSKFCNLNLKRLAS